MPTASDIITTVGGSTSNSYISLADAQTLFFDLRLDAGAWLDASEEDKVRALIMAAKRLNRENWLGERVTTTQKLAWPRYGVAKIDSGGIGGYAGYGYTYPDQYESTEIPQEVKDAQCELALAYLDGFSDNAGGDSISEFRADDVTVKLKNEQPSGDAPDSVMLLIGALLRGNELVRG